MSFRGYLSALIFWLFLAMVMLSPIAFGSIYPWSSTLISVVTATLLLGWVAHLLIDNAQPAISLNQTWYFIVPFVLIILLITLQIVSWTPDSLHHPLWKITEDVLGTPVEGRISVDAHESATGLMRVLTYGGIFWLALQYGRDVKNARRLLVSLAGLGGLCALYGLIVEFYGLNLILWYDKEYYIGSVTSVFHYKNSYATYAAMGLLCVLGLAFENYAANSRIGGERTSARRRLIAWVIEHGWLPLVVIIMLASALVLTNSRAGLVSGGLGVVALLLLLRYSYLKETPYIRSMANITFFIIVAVTLIGGAGVWDRLGRINPERDLRLTATRSVTTAVQDSPWTGTGSGTFDEAFTMYHPEEIPLRILRAHNTYLENAFELGIPGTILMLIAVGLPAIWCLRGAIRRRRRGVYPMVAVATTVTIAAHATMDFTIQVPAIAVTYFALLGVGCAQSWSSTETVSGGERVPSA